MDYPELADLGASILAMLHSGLVRFDCSKCTSKEELNCNLSIEQDSPVFNSAETGELYACPIRMIPSWVSDWYDEYLHNKTFRVSDRYEDKLKLQWEFERAYIRYYNEYQIKASKKKQVDTDPGNKKMALNSFRSVANRNKK